MQLIIIIISIIAFSAVLIAVAHEPATEAMAQNALDETPVLAAADEPFEELATATDLEPVPTPMGALIQDIQPQRTAPVFFEQIGPDEAEQPRFSPYVLDLRGLEDQA